MTNTLSSEKSVKIRFPFFFDEMLLSLFHILPLLTLYIYGAECFGLGEKHNEGNLFFSLSTIGVLKRFMRGRTACFLFFWFNIRDDEY